MIQRIQTIYLLLSGLLMTSMFFLPLAELASENETYTFLYRGFENSAEELVMPTWALAILITVSTLISYITIFLYKKRILQIRLSGLNIGLMLGTAGMIYYLASEGTKEFATELSDKAEMAYNYPVVFPVIALILTYLAIRAIGKDEALIRSMDRIR